MATLVFRNGGVFDGSRHRPGEALVVTGDRVTAVLPEADLDGSGLDLLESVGG